MALNYVINLLAIIGFSRKRSGQCRCQRIGAGSRICDADDWFCYTNQVRDVTRQNKRHLGFDDDGPKKIAPRNVGVSPRIPVGWSVQQLSIPNPNASPNLGTRLPISMDVITVVMSLIGRKSVASVAENAISPDTLTSVSKGANVFTDTVNMFRVIVDSESGRGVAVFPGG